MFKVEIPGDIDYILTTERNTGVSSNGRYCNVTLVYEDSTDVNVPYPHRFKC